MTEQQQRLFDRVVGMLREAAPKWSEKDVERMLAMPTIKVDVVGVTPVLIDGPNVRASLPPLPPIRKTTSTWGGPGPVSGGPGGATE